MHEEDHAKKWWNDPRISGVYKSSLIDLEFLPDNAEDNKGQAAKACSLNVASEKTSDKTEDAVL